ncbi:MAG TPA: hypothetical protein PLM98_15855, partial [Thiolinea sp.]|nr:hypothetical protein [Thiolinea sp.]
PYALSIVSDLFHYDLTEIKNSLVEKSDIETIGEKINNSLKEITKSLESINKKLETTNNLANSSGLKLSITTLRNLKHLLEKNNNFEKLQPQYVDLEVFMEVLGVDRDMADRLNSFFSHPQWQNAKTLEEVEGMTDQLLQQINTHFRVS